MMSALRTVWVTLNALLATLTFGPLAIVIGLLGYEGAAFTAMSRAWCRWILWASGTTVYVQGMEHIRRDRPQVFVSNHQSWYDVFAIGGTIPKHFRFVAKKELASIPLFGLAWRLAGHISIDRSDRNAAIESLHRAGELLRRDNGAVIMFPEGTRSRTGELLPFKKGAFMLALGMDVEIVPTMCVGTRDIMGKGDWRVHRGPIILRFGEPVDTTVHDESMRDELIETVRARMIMLKDGSLPAGAAVGGDT